MAFLLCQQDPGDDQRTGRYHTLCAVYPIKHGHGFIVVISSGPSDSCDHYAHILNIDSLALGQSFNFIMGIPIW